MENTTIDCSMFLYDHLAYVSIILVGLSVILTGLVLNSFIHTIRKPIVERNHKLLEVFTKLFEKVTSIFPLSTMKKEIQTSLAITLMEGNRVGLLSGTITIVISIVSIMLIVVLQRIGQLWYVRILLAGMGAVLPYYLATLILDLYRYHIGRTIPRLIDEFRSSFIRHNKIRPALKECSLYIDKGLGRIISRASDSTFIEQSLNTLRDRFDNAWFNIFVVLLLNFKENGGELIDQLYRLNRTMTRYNSIEKKKNSRLIWYEVFAVGASVFSIPAIFMVNSLILGNDQPLPVDAGTNILISQTIGFSMLSLVVIRILRRL